MTITKADLITNLVDNLGIENHEAKAVVELFFETIRKALIRGETVKLSGFGKFRVLNKRERLARNPRTGEAAIVSARRAVSFVPGDVLKERINKENQSA